MQSCVPISSLGLVGMNLVCCMSGTGIEARLRTRFVVGVMVLLEAPAIACGEWALWEAALPS